MNMATFERRLCSMWPSIAIALQTSGLLCIASVCALLYDDRSLLLSVERLFALGAATPTAAYCAVVAPPPQSRRRPSGGSSSSSAAQRAVARRAARAGAFGSGIARRYGRERRVRGTGDADERHAARALSAARAVPTDLKL